MGGSAPGKAPIYTHWALGERALLSSCVFDDFRLEDTLSQTEMTFPAPRTVRAPQTPLCNPLAFWDLRVKKKDPLLHSKLNGGSETDEKPKPKTVALQVC